MSPSGVGFYYFGCGRPNEDEGRTNFPNELVDGEHCLFTDPYSDYLIHVMLDKDLDLPFLTLNLNKQGAEIIEKSRKVYESIQMDLSDALYEGFKPENVYHYISQSSHINGIPERVYIVSSGELYGLMEEEDWRWETELHRFRFQQRTENINADVAFRDDILSYDPLSESNVKVEILGNVQDGGVPHLGCTDSECRNAYKNPEFRRHASSLLFKDLGPDQGNILIQATPDMRFQLGPRADQLDGIFIPHGHIGHFSGLLMLGPEVMNAKDITLYCSEATKNYLTSGNLYEDGDEVRGPFKNLFHDNRLDDYLFAEFPEHGLKIGDCQFSPIEVVPSHEGDSDKDNYAFLVDGPNRKLFYAPVLEEWRKGLIEKVHEADIAIVDGCFWKRGDDAPFDTSHPPIRQSMNLLDASETQIMFTDINHTNPVLNESSEAYEKLEEQDFELAPEGSTKPI